MFGLGFGEIAIVAIIIFFFFGSKKLPELGKGIGQAIKEFKKAGSEISDDEKS
ncbi:MAG: twin-arginine translocase TatA/TatE family subunit [Bacteriovoracaceae bacterium]